MGLLRRTSASSLSQQTYCYNADLQGLYGTNAGCSSALTAALHSNTLPKVEKVPNGQCLVTTSEGETMHGCPVLSEAITSCIKACTFWLVTFQLHTTSYVDFFFFFFFQSWGLGAKVSLVMIDRANACYAWFLSLILRSDKFFFFF